MIEFGSDFHYVESVYQANSTIGTIFPSAQYYADGRMALIALYQSQGWQRLWMPEYFCYDVIESLKQAGLDLRFYADHPGYNGDDNTLDAIQRNGHFHPMDAVLRVNYFGMRSYRNAERLSVAAIVEDHTHDLLGGWARNSRADWCIASLRKTLPIPEGGLLWSPKNLPLPGAPEKSEENEEIASIRWNAMKLKTRYLAGEDVEKAAFRKGFVETEPFFDTAQVCALDATSQEYLNTFDIQDWYNKKRENWHILSEIHKEGVRILFPETESCYPFSLILLFGFMDDRDRVRKELIANNIYPAVLWNIPATLDGDIFKMSHCMLSIHCDARYTREDIMTLKSIIESVL